MIIRHICFKFLRFHGIKEKRGMANMLRVAELIAVSDLSQRKLHRLTGISLATINAMVNGQRTYLTEPEEVILAKIFNVNRKELYKQGGL